MFNALEDSPAGNDMDFVAKLHLVEKHIRNNNLKLTFADRLGIAEDDEGEISSQVTAVSLMCAANNTDDRSTASVLFLRASIV